MRNIILLLFVAFSLFAQAQTPMKEIAALKDKYYEAFDKLEVEKISNLLHKEFIFTGFRNNQDLKPAFIDKIKTQAKVGAQPGKRTWKDEKINFFGNTAIFSGTTSFKFTKSQDSTAHQSFITQVWTKENNTWLLAALTEHNVVSGDAEPDWFDQIYRQKTFYIAKPNALLQQAIKNIKPGKALDMGMGQGRNSIFMAQQGWKVTGFDISPEGLRQANESAKKLSLKLTTVLQGIEDFDFGTNEYDLISSIYFGPRGYAEKIKAGLKPGGILVVEAHHRDATKLRNMPEYVVFDTDELKTMFKDFKILFYEEADGVADWGNWGEQKIKLVKMIAQKK